jgi:outer membrane protein assembly factor BamB
MSIMRSCCCCLSLVVALAILVFADSAQGDDWPQWRGPQRTGLSAETGLLKNWPKGGPKLLWSAKGLGGGYATPSIAAGRVYGMGYRGNDEVVWALNEATGKEAWVATVGRANRGVGNGEGPRCTPTIDGNRLYALGVSGDLVCMDTANGRIIWRKNLVRDFKGGVPHWGYSESPLIDGTKVIVTPGGSEATLAALNKATGAVIWKARVPQGDGAAYASVIAADADGGRQYVQFLSGGVVGVAADSGKFLWRYDAPHNGTANCSTAIFHDQCVFAASGYGTGGGLVRLTRQGDKTQAREEYFTRKMQNHHGGMVLVEGFLYGANEATLMCLDFKTGAVKWQSREPGKGSLGYADGCLYFRNEGGPVYLIAASPEAYRELGRFDPPDRSNHSAWAHPVVANGKLFILDQDVLLCFDVKQQ